MRYFVLFLALAVGCVMALARMRKRQTEQQELVRRMRSSGMYAGVYGVFLEARKGYVEQVTLSAEEVCVTMLQPEGRRLRYMFDEHGIDPLSEDMARALSQAAAIDLPCLRDTRYYTLRKGRERGRLGQAGTVYRYIIRQERKDYLLHAIRAKNRQISH